MKRLLSVLYRLQDQPKQISKHKKDAFPSFEGLLQGTNPSRARKNAELWKRNRTASPSSSTFSSMSPTPIA